MRASSTPSRGLAALAGLLLILPVAGLLPGAAAQPPPPVSSEAGPATVYPTYPVLTAELERLAHDHPDILRLHSAGTTDRGLELWYVEVANLEDANRTPLEEREVLWVDGGTHANEYSGVMFVMHLLRWLAEGYGVNDTATWIVEERHTFIMPLLNPEGSLNGIGRLNGNLVNINRNYPVGWGDLAESPVFNNPGPYPASEPETRAVIEQWDRLQPDYMASIHCCGNLWLYPYGIEGVDPHPDDGPMYERVCREGFPTVVEDCGPIWSTIYPASGSSVDTAYERTGAVSFGYEMSGREAQLFWGPPATTSDIEEMESESWRGLLHAFMNVHRFGAHPEVAVASTSTDTVTFTVQNTGWANLTEARVSVVDAQGLEQTVHVPSLAPGATADVTLPGTYAPGEHDLTVTYRKRPLAPLHSVSPGLAVAGTAEGLVASVGGTVADLRPAGGVNAEAAGDAEVPTAHVGLVLVAAVLAGLAVGRRRDL